MKRFSVTLALAATVLAATGPALGKEAEVREVRVSYKALDLNQNKDAKQFLYRLHLAAKSACTVIEVNRPSPALREAIASCTDHAVAEAVSTLDKPALTRVYAARK